MSMGSLAVSQKNVVLMLEILRTGFSRSINAACSGMVVQGGFIPRFCCNKYLGCLSYLIAFKAYHRENTRQVSLEIISCIFD